MVVVEPAPTGVPPVEFYRDPLIAAEKAKKDELKQKVQEREQPQVLRDIRDELIWARMQGR